MRVRHLFNLSKVKGEVTTVVSATEPNQAMTIKEIVSRYANGLPLSGIVEKKPIYCITSNFNEESDDEFNLSPIGGDYDLSDYSADMEAWQQKVKNIRSQSSQT